MARTLRTLVVVLSILAQAPLAVASTDAENERRKRGPDPWEGFNRKIFWFNEKADIYVLEPVAKGWDFVVPEMAQTGIRNVFDNLATPLYMANHILQLRPKKASQDLARVVINSTIGVGGLIDVATIEGIPSNETGFGLTLGRWGVPAGPYLMIPIFGPSTPRQAVGLLADSTAAGYTYFVPVYVALPIATVRIINQRSIFLEQIDMERESALDFYVFVRDAYLQNLNMRERGGSELSEEQEDDLYYIDDEEFDDGSEDLDAPSVELQEPGEGSGDATE